MRNALSELPILLFCIRGGFIAGGACFLLRLPKRLYSRSLRGRRARLIPTILTAVSETAAALAAALGFAATLLIANGGELRLYAVCGFFAALAGAYAALNALVLN